MWLPVVALFVFQLQTLVVAIFVYWASRQDSKLKQGDKCVEQPGEVVFAAPEDDLEPLEQDDVLKQQILSKAPSHEPFRPKISGTGSRTNVTTGIAPTWHPRFHS